MLGNFLSHISAAPADATIHKMRDKGMRNVREPQIGGVKNVKQVREEVKNATQTRPGSSNLPPVGEAPATRKR